MTQQHITAPQTAPFDPYRNLGIEKLGRSLSRIVAIGEGLLTAPPEKGDSHGSYASSCISLSELRPSPQVTPGETLLIDIGGSHTKVALRDAKGNWTLLFDRDNKDFRDQPGTTHATSLHEFLAVLAATIVDAAKDRGGEIKNVGVIWSNIAQSKRIASGAYTGVTALFSDKTAALSQKGEWFIEGFKKGNEQEVDLGEILISELVRGGVNPTGLAIMNDTVAVLFAAEMTTGIAAGGVVISTGSNCTGCDPSTTILNAELGAAIIVPEDLLAPGDSLFMQRAKLSQLSLQQLMSGKWFSDLVAAHVITAAKKHPDLGLTGIANDLEARKSTLQNPDLSAWLRDRSKVPAPLTPLSETGIKAVHNITTALVRRGGELGGALTYLSVLQRIQQGGATGELVVSLDSSMGRHFDGFLNSLTTTVKALVDGNSRPEKPQIKIALVQPLTVSGGEIPSPMQGLARLFEYLKT